MKTFALIALFFFSFSGFSQGKRELARKQIETLKAGSLLVRLQTGEKQIKALELSGDKTGADAYRKKVADENRLFVEAFRKDFRFCPVYFFYSSCSEPVRLGQIKGCLLNNQFQPDSSLTPSGEGFLTAGLGFSDGQQLEGLILMDAGFDQLKDPFPFLIRRNEGPLHRRTEEELVLRLEKELNDFYLRR